MNNFELGLICFIIIAIWIYRRYYDTISANLVMLLTIKRGILSPNSCWQYLSTLYHDRTGIKLFKRLKSKDKIVPVKLGTTTMNIITDLKIIRYVLENSPTIFGVGKFKYNFFKGFMKHNVGVLNDPHWHSIRKYNECVLASDQKHPFINYWERLIVSTLNEIDYDNNDNIDFDKVAKFLTAKIVFGLNKIPEEIYDQFKKTNSIKFLFTGDHGFNQKINKRIKEFYHSQIILDSDSELESGSQSLIYLAKRCPFNHSKKDWKIDQIPHWIFPINGLFAVHSPRLIKLLKEEKQTLNKLIYLKNSGDKRECFKLLRWSILELFRLNNPVNSSFRTVQKSINLGGKQYNKGDQLMISNIPILRDSEFWNKPEMFLPERWKYKDENSTESISFNHGPQRCPGKELAISLISIFVYTIFLKI